MRQRFQGPRCVCREPVEWIYGMKERELVICGDGNDLEGKLYLSEFTLEARSEGRSGH